MSTAEAPPVPAGGAIAAPQRGLEDLFVELTGEGFDVDG